MKDIVTDQSTNTQMGLRCTVGVLAAAARMVPVPLLDDVLRRKIYQLLVSRTLKAHGRRFASDQVSVFFNDGKSFLDDGLLLPVKLVLFPIRKVVNTVLLARHLAFDLSYSVLLGRTLDRCLAAGMLAEDASVADRSREAERIHTAFLNAIAGVDMKFLRSALGKVSHAAGGWLGAANRSLRELRGKNIEENVDPAQSLSSSDQSRLQKMQESLQEILETEEMRAFLEDFDAKLDENLEVHRPG